jgi:chromosome segregation protein
MLKSLEINGFKSFAKKGDIRFTSAITAIVGPNGSGKSNVAESFRFALGEQSMKSLRGKKTEDLIFNGSDMMPRANRASVKLVFDNSKRLLGVDFDEVSIERVIHRDSLSEYYVNGTQVRLKDVVELLAAANIGSSGHHIISQGEADRILSANIKERKEMIEDALGLKVYQYKRDESVKKLAKTRENMERVASLRREIAPHLKFLKKQVEKIEKTKALREEVRALYRDYLANERAYVVAEENAIAESEKGPQVELAQLAIELARAREVLESSKVRDARTDEVVILESEIGALRVRKDACAREIGRLEGELASLVRMKAREESKAIRGDIAVSWREIETNLKDVIGACESVSGSSDVNALQNALGQAKSVVATLLLKYASETIKSDTTEIDAEIVTLTQGREEALKALEVVRVDEELVSQKRKSLEFAIDSDKDASRDAEKELFRIMALENEARGKLSMLKVRKDKIHIEKEAFAREVEEGMVLIGRSVYEYESHQVTGKSGTDRSVQEDCRRAIERIKVRIEDSGALGGEDVVREHNETEERDTYLIKELADLEASIVSIEIIIKELEERLDVMFKEGIKKINDRFGEFFALMFGGGTASLSIVREKKRKRALEEGELPDPNENEEGEEGVAIDVSLPRKKIRGLEMLSGGERALTSIALLFAISQVNPPPFVILDETDAALDEANAKKYGDMIESLSKHSQLIVITHNRETMSRASVLYGITMGKEGCSKLLSIAFGEAVLVAK